MSHIHSVYDTDPHFSIDPATRALTNLSKTKTLIIQNDHNSERFTFELPRYIDGHDMSLCDSVQIHYINIGDGKDSKNLGLYEVDDLQVSPNSEDVVICSWLISRNATRFAGSLNFIIRFACTTGSKLDYVWHTAVYSGITVSSGISNTEVIVEDYHDVLVQWANDMYKRLEETNALPGVTEIDNGKILRVIDGQWCVVQQIPSITGNGAPASTTEGAVGCLYMDTLTGKMYKCTTAENGVFTWDLVGGEKGEDGITPHIGDNGNWYIGDTDTGVMAQHLSDGVPVVQTTGDSETDVMSQKATTDAINAVFDIYHSTNLLNEETATIGVGMAANGTEYTGDSYAGYALTDYIPVKEGDVLAWQGLTSGASVAKSGTMRWVCAFDANKNVLSAKGSNTALKSYTVPEGVAYARLSLQYYTSYANPMVHFGTDILPYEPYYTKRILKEAAHNEGYIKELINSENDVFEEYESANLLNPETTTIGKGMAANGTLYDLAGGVLTDYIEVSEGDVLTYQGVSDGSTKRGIYSMRWVCAFDVYKNVAGALGSNDAIKSYTVPSGVSFVRLSLSAASVLSEIAVVKSADVIPYEPYFKGKKLKEESFPNSSRRLALPTTIYAFANHPVSVYFRNIMDYHPDDVYASATGESTNDGKLYRDRWEYTPTAETAKIIEFRVYNHDYDLINNEMVTLSVKATSAKNNLTALVIGDSTVNSGHETQKMLDLATADGYNLTLLGTRGSDTNKHEGRGGWTAKMYTKTASSTSVGTNPFYNPTTETFDFAYYMTQQGYSGVDCVFLQLGINDVFSATLTTIDKMVGDYITNMERIVESIHSYDSNIKVVINLIIPCGTDQDAFAGYYNLGAIWQKKKNTYEANIALLDRFEGVANVYLSPYNAAIDTENNLPTDVHPNEEGYAQLGTQMYSYMRAIN